MTGTGCDPGSLNGGKPVELTVEQVTDGWRALVSSFDATHHQLGNFLIDEIGAEHARLRFYGTATHILAVPGQDSRWCSVVATRRH